VPVLKLLLEGQATRGTLRCALAELGRVGRSRRRREIVGIEAIEPKLGDVQARGCNPGYLVSRVRWCATSEHRPSTRKENKIVYGAKRPTKKSLNPRW
jgi:hypothetical protein